jgi:hypothetical protein
VHVLPHLGSASRLRSQPYRGLNDDIYQMFKKMRVSYRRRHNGGKKLSRDFRHYDQCVANGVQTRATFQIYPNVFALSGRNIEFATTTTGVSIWASTHFETFATQELRKLIKPANTGRYQEDTYGQDGV